MSIDNSEGMRQGAGALDTLSPLAIRVRAEYQEMPGMRLTVGQAARLFGLAPDVADAVRWELQSESILTCSTAGLFALVSAGR